MAALRSEVSLTSHTSKKVYADETSTDIANNRSYITVSMSIYARGGASATSYECNVTGAGGASGALNVGAGETVLCSGGFWASHNSDGTGNATVGSYFSSTWKSMSYAEFSIGLTTIPRASTPSIVGGSNVVAGSTITIVTNRKSTNFTHSITATFGYHTKTWTGVTDSVAWVVPTNWLDSIANAQMGYGAIACSTMNGSTQIGDTVAIALNIYVPTDAIPKMGGWGATELNENVKSMTADGTVQQISRKDVYVTKVVAEYYSTIVSVVCNGVALTQQSDGSWHGTLSNLSSGTYKFEAKDSRGLSSGIGTTSQTFYEYSRPQFLESSLKRTDETGSDGSFAIKGSYSKLLQNNVTMTTQRAVNGIKETAKSVTPTQSSGEVSYSESYSDLYYTNSYDVTATITDAFGESATVTVHLGVGKYALWLGKSSCTLGQGSRMLDSSGTVRTLVDMFYPIGSYYETSDTSFNPNTVWGGTWVKLEDGRMLISSSSSHTVGSTGGKENAILIASIGATNNNANLIAYESPAVSSYQKTHKPTYTLSTGGVVGTFTHWNHGTSVTDVAIDDQGVNWMNPYLVVVRWHRTA